MIATSPLCKRAPALFRAVAILGFLALTTSFLCAQATISTGSIQGTITDPTGAVVVAAKVSITDKATGHVVTTATTSSGTYTSGGLIPSVYVVRVEAQGFKTVEEAIAVEVGVTSSVNFK